MTKKKKKYVLPEEVKEFFRQAGRRGGKNSRKNLDEDTRRALAQKAARSRWAKKGLKAVALAVLLLLPVRASAEKAHAWETATVLSQQLTGGTGGVFAAPLGGGVMGVPIYRRSNRIVLETPQYRFTLDEVGRKTLVVVVHDTVQYYRDGKYFVMLDAEKHKHKFVMTGIEKRQ